MSDERDYEIFSKAMLPARFGGLHTYAEAYAMCCDWNTWHLPQDMTYPVKRDPEVMLMEFA